MSNLFVGEMKVTYLEHNRYRYDPDPVFWMGYIDSKDRTFSLNEPFETDLASTPRLTWVIPGFEPDRFGKSALVHDYLYHRHHQGKDILGFKESNALLEEMVITEGGSRWLAWGYRVACDIGAGWAWNRSVGGMTNNVDKQLLSTLIQLMEKEKWKTIHDVIITNPFMKLSPKAQVTLASVLNHPEVLEHMPMLKQAVEAMEANERFKARLGEGDVPLV